MNGIILLLPNQTTVPPNIFVFSIIWSCWYQNHLFQKEMNVKFIQHIKIQRKIITGYL